MKCVSNAINAIEWLLDRADRRNPFRKNSPSWRDWEEADAEQFILARQALEGLRSVPQGECICPTCGLRHGIQNSDGGF